MATNVEAAARIAGEREVVRGYLEALAAEGFLPVKASYGGADIEPLSGVQDALDAVFEADVCHVAFRHTDDVRRGVVMFVLGNSPVEVAADYGGHQSFTDTVATFNAEKHHAAWVAAVLAAEGKRVRPPMTPSMTVVVYRARTERVPCGPFRDDLGESPRMMERVVVDACVWLHNATDADLEKARDWAALEDPQWSAVGLVGVDEPLEAARSIALGSAS